MPYRSIDSCEKHIGLIEKLVFIAFGAIIAASAFAFDWNRDQDKERQNIRELWMEQRVLNTELRMFNNELMQAIKSQQTLQQNKQIDQPKLTDMNQ